MAARSIFLLALLFLCGQPLAAQPVLKEINKMLPFLFLPEQNTFLAPPAINDTLTIIVYTSKNCYPCFPKTCTYLNQNKISGKRYFLDFRAGRKAEALGYSRSIQAFFPCAVAGLYLLNDSVKQSPLVQYLMHIPSPYFLVGNNNSWRIEHFLLK